MKDLIPKSLTCNTMFFCHLCNQQQKNKKRLEAKLFWCEMQIYLVYCTFKKVLFVFLLMSACQIIVPVYQLSFQSKSELKLAEHKGNFKTATYHRPELHLLYIFVTSKLQQIEEQAYQGHQHNMVFSSNNSYIYGFILFKH